MEIQASEYQILKLTEKFYMDYPNPPYVEILQKEKRAYNCVLFQTHYDYFICIPYRTEIVHKFSYRFKNSKRSKKHKSGLDYTKIIIVKNKEYIDAENAIIDRDEFKETNINIERIKKEALLYVEEYICGIKEKDFMNKKENMRKYGYSTLKYFHNELGIVMYTEEADENKI